MEVSKEKAEDQNNGMIGRHRFITVDSVAAATKDLFALIVDTDLLLRVNGISSLEFMSDVLSAPTQIEKLSFIIAALKTLKHEMEQEEEEPQQERGEET